MGAFKKVHTGNFLELIHVFVDIYKDIQGLGILAKNRGTYLGVPIIKR